MQQNELTKEEQKICKKHSKLLESAYKYKTATGYTDNVFDELYPIYYRIFKHKMSKTCNHCKMTVAIAIGKLYHGI